MARRDPAKLVEDAWEALDELTSAGKATLPGGRVLAPDDKVLVTLLQWLASREGRPKKTPKAFDDWKPPETKA